MPHWQTHLLVCIVLALPAALSGTGCAAAPPRPVPVNAPVAEAGVVFVLDGAGNFQACSQHIRKALDLERLPMELVTVDWSHGYGRILADQVGYSYSRSEGQKLAQVLLQYRAEHPGVPLHLVGHSAGSAVVVAALENLPPDVIDRAFLLAPSLSANYDVRPALHSVKYGLHVYYSVRDTAYLGVWTGILGNSDRHWGPSAGRIGFQTSPQGGPDSYLYGKLHQRAWEPGDRALGNDGKHYGDYQPGFVRTHIVPLLAGKM